MNEEAFLARRQDRWTRLVTLCDRASISPTALNGEELKEFIRLYRGVSRDLAVVRTQSNNAPLIDYLNDLAGRAYGILYRAPAKPFFATIVSAVERAAQTFRRRFMFILASFILFAGAGITTPVLIKTVPDTRAILVPEQMEASFEGWKNGLVDERTSGESTMMTAFYASNNPRAAILTGAVGAGTFGIGSVIFIVMNGAIIGALGLEMASVGKLGFLFANIAPHGVPELSGLFISGAAGLLLGWALVFPGRFTRGDALREVGPDAVTLLATSVVMMFIAAPIEGFFSFNQSIPIPVKIIVAVIELVLWTFFWMNFGRSKDAKTPPETQR